jgi:predicted AlkP superfamily pyrophosphatase or phosphodiesterase
MRGTAPIRIFVLIDALGWRYVREYQFLRQLLRYRVPVRTVLGFSSAAIPTILTGVAPERHGHWNLFYYNPERSPFAWLRPLSFLPDRFLNSRLGRRAITEIGRRTLGLGPLFECSLHPRLLPWFDWVEKRNIFASGGISGAPSFFDELAERGVPCRTYTYRDLPDDKILRAAEGDLASDGVRVLFLYLSELDRVLHDECADDSRCAAAIEHYETRLEALFLKALDRDPQATFAVFSDHGMTRVRAYRNLASEIRALRFRMPEDFLAVYDSTMARYWFFSERAREAITGRLRKIPGGRILREEELRRLGIWFGDCRYGELIYLLDPGWLLTDSDFHRGGWKPAGMHGYHPDDPDSDGIFLSNREPSSPIREVGDVHGFLRQATFGTADCAATR